jgi:hypothetical protein
VFDVSLLGVEDSTDCGPGEPLFAPEAGGAARATGGDVRSLLVLGLVAGTLIGTARGASAQSSQNERASPGGAVVTPLPNTEIRPYEEGAPVPPGYHVIERRATGLAVVGGVLFGVGYSTTVLTGFFLSLRASSVGDSRDSTLLLVPGVGPFAFMIAEGRFNEAEMFIGSVQLAGVGLMVLGTTTPPTRTLVRDAFALRAAAPVALPGGGGFLLSGTF